MTVSDKQSNTITSTRIPIIVITSEDFKNKKIFQFYYYLLSSVASHFEGHFFRYLDIYIIGLFNASDSALKASIFFIQYLQAYKKNTQFSLKLGIFFDNFKISEDIIYDGTIDSIIQTVNMLDENKIHVTDEFYQIVKNTQSVYFEAVTIDKNLPLYKVSWDQNLKILPYKPIICFHFIHKIADKNFINLWKELTQGQTIETIEKKIKEKRVLADNFMLIETAVAEDVIEIIKSIFDFISNKFTVPINMYPIQIIVYGSLNIAENMPAWLEGCLQEMVPGCIYISEEILYAIYSIEQLDLIKISIGKNGKKFYRIVYLSNQKKYPTLPLNFYSYVLASGNNNPCFYCGSRKHINSKCPSKKIIDYTDSITKIGYLSPEKINGLLFKILQFETDYIDIEQMNNMLRAIFESLFEISRIFQIGFLKSIWNINSNRWMDIRKNKSDQPSGILWLAVEALRTANYDKARKLLKRAEDENLDKFKLNCIYGFLNIDYEDYDNAENYFKKALIHTKHEIHNTYLKLLLARIYYIQGRINEALNQVEDIVYKDGSCIDAIYLAIILNILSQKDTKKIKKMLMLFEVNKEFFLYAYIDPQLCGQNIVTEKLNEIFKTAKYSAEEVFHSATTEFNQLAVSLDESTVSDIKMLYSKSKEAISTESYFGYLDAQYYSEHVIMKCRNFLYEKRKEAERSLTSLLNSVIRKLEFFKSFRYKRFISHEQEQLIDIINKIYLSLKTLDKVAIKEIDSILKLCDDIKKQLPDIEAKISDLTFLEKFLTVILTFGKLTAIFLGSLFIFCFIIIPILATNINIETALGSFFYELYAHKTKIFFWGGVVTFLISFGSAIRKILKYN